ncbi:hypothetical protein [Pseudomonas sp.]|uniref:hypothetical protein n=1 Tax=Pseudomonas sp. TaxID=306 RepID=UPI00258C88E9|nr:hypothetical protein [Pseudomonas sp.]
MARVLKSFLIGLGYDTKKLEEGEKKFGSSIGGIKSKTLTTSAALIGAFALAATSVAATASEVDQLALRTQNLRTSTQTVYNFGNAIKLMGGDAADAVSALSRFEEIQNNFRLRGDAGPIADLALAGIDVTSLYGTQTGEEFARALAGMLPGLNEGQRSIVQESLGLSDATFRSLVGGIDALDASLQRAQGLTGSIDQLTDDSRKLRENMAEFGLIIDGVTNEIAEKFLKSMVGASESVNEFVKSIRGGISESIDVLSDNPEATATLGASAAVAASGSLLSKLGLSGVGGALKTGGTVGAVASAAQLGAPLVEPTFDWLLGVDRTPQQSQVYTGVIDRSRSAGDSMAPTQSVEDARKAEADALAGALSRSPLKVENNVNMTVQLDGSALDAKIIDVTEQQSYQALEDMRTTTDR